MGKTTAITWTDHTFNVWWGCVHAPAEPDADPDDISEECRHCYAESFDKRTGGGGGANTGRKVDRELHWGATAPRRFFGDAYWSKPLQWNAEAERVGVRARVFCSSMADWAEIHADPEINARMNTERRRLWRLIRATPWLDWLLLTKRAENLAIMLPWEIVGRVAHRARNDAARARIEVLARPWPNVWVGVTAGNRRSLWRVHKLREVRAVVRFVSCEPLLDHITSLDWDRALALDAIDDSDLDPGDSYNDGLALPVLAPIHWLIVGDENGPRRAQVDWVRTAREAAVRHGVTFHLKQWCGPSSPAMHGMRAENNNGTKGKIHLPVLDGKQWEGIPRIDRDS